MKSSGGKILIIRGGAIGDFILTLPAITALRRQFPQVHLEVLGYPHIVQLALAGGLVNRVQPIEARPLAGFFARGGTLEEDWADYFSDFDVIVSYLYDPDGIFRTNVARCSRAQFIVGPHRPVESENVHATKVYLRPLERLAIFDADPVPRLAIDHSAFGSGSDATAPRRSGGPTVNPQPAILSQIALHPGSGSEKKNWPEGNWAGLITRLLHNGGARLLIMGGEAEGERLQRLAAGLPPDRCRVAQSLPLPELARRLQCCGVFAGHDSGISHLAAAVGVPSVILWADTTEAIWRPQGERLVVLRSPAGVRSISVDTVFQSVTGLLHASTKGQ